jgi:16S rRNA (uracil1498-N3)-methyltransferase
MHRFYLPAVQCQASSVALRNREAYHAVHVLRLTSRQQVTVLDGEGQTLVCEVAEATREFVRLVVTERRHSPLPPFEMTLLQAVPKGRIMEDIIEKATELGVRRIVPLLAERVVTRLPGAGAEAKALKWRQTAIEAIKQSGNPWLPKIETPLIPRAFLERGESFDFSIIGSLIDAPCHLRAHLKRYQERHQRLPRTVAVWIGPEGDFTPAEVALAKAAGALPIDLGPLVLRCETAALYCLSVLHHELRSQSPSLTVPPG